MPVPTLRRVLTATSAAVGALVLGLGTAPAQATTPLNYAALGDSYSAASGVLPVDLTSPLCLRSTANYPHVIAARTAARLTDVTCGAAQTKDFTEAQYPGVAPQADAVTADTDLVTLTIGGNENGTFITPSPPAAPPESSAAARAVPARTATARPSTTRSTPAPIPR